MHRRTIKLGSLVAAAAFGLVASPVGAEWLTNVTTNQTNIAYWKLDPTNCTLTKNLSEPDQAGLQELLRGTNSECIPNQSPGPGGNIELGDDDFAVWEKVSTLEGNICGGRVRLSSLKRADWGAVLPSGNTLAEQYVADAIFANCGVVVPPSVIDSPAFQTQLNDCFLNGNCGGSPITPPPAQRASDPNIAYINSNANGSISIGLAGPLDASGLIPLGIDCSMIPGGQQRGPIRASEVAKFEVLQGGQPVGKPEYAYGFAVIESGITTDDETGSYDGNYNWLRFLLQCRRPPPPVQVPAAPATGLFITLVGLAFAGIRSLRRRSDGR